MNPCRNDLLRTLPLLDETLTIRLCERSDLELLSAWPDYPAPYAQFRLSLSSLTPAERDALFRERERQPDRITLVTDLDSAKAIGYVALLGIDWDEGAVRNMSVRIHPGRCDRGLGSCMIGLVSDWCFAAGFKSLRLDVAAPNRRAVRCYEKAGFRRCGELWRTDEGLKELDLGAEENRHIKDHVRLKDGAPQVRFWLMERVRD